MNTRAIAALSLVLVLSLHAPGQAIGPGDFSAPTTFPVTTSQDPPSPRAVVLSQLNGDGHLDAVVANQGTGTVAVLLGNGTGVFGAPTEIAGFSGPVAVALGLFNNDAHLDLVVVNQATAKVSILLGNGTGAFANRQDFDTGASPAGVAVGDLNDDGLTDVVVVNQGDSTVSVLLGNGDGTLDAKVDFATGAGPVAVALGDLDGNGTLDVVTANSTANTVSVLLGDGEGGFGDATDFPTAAGPAAVRVVRVDADAPLDLLVVAQGASRLSVLLGVGDGTFGAKTDFVTGATPVALAAADVDGNGTLDVVTANLDGGSISVLRGQGNGSFAAKTDFPTGAGPTAAPRAIVLGQLNTDGALDAVTVEQLGGTLSVLLGNAPPLLNVGPASQAFGNVKLGAFADRVFTVTNSGGSTLTGEATVGAPFSIVNGSPFNIGAGLTQDVTVRFSPVTADVFATNVSFTSNVGNASRGVSGTGVPLVLTVAKAGGGNGVVRSDVAGIDCGADCTESYGLNAAVTLVATAAAGSVFTGWTGDCAGTAPCVLSMTADRNVTATFATSATAVQLTVTTRGSATGVVLSNPSGVSCGAICTASFANGTQVQLTATPQAGAVFKQWGGACSGTVNTCTVAMTEARAVTATYSKTFTDPTLSPGITTVKAVHLNDLRAAINALRAVNNLAAFAFTNPVLTPGSTPVKRIHVIDLRNALGQAYAAAGVTAPTYTDATITVGVTKIRAVHLNELRNAVRALE